MYIIIVGETNVYLGIVFNMYQREDPWEGMVAIQYGLFSVCITLLSVNSNLHSKCKPPLVKVTSIYIG